jgi:hypothetical protein
LKLPVSTEHDAALLAWKGAVQTAQAMFLEAMKLLGDQHTSALSADRTLSGLRQLELRITSELSAALLDEHVKD